MNTIEVLSQYTNIEESINISPFNLQMMMDLIKQMPPIFHLS